MKKTADASIRSPELRVFSFGICQPNQSQNEFEVVPNRAGAQIASDLVIAESQSALSLWSYDECRGALHRIFQTTGFVKATGLILDVALEAYNTNSHLEWLVARNRLEVWLFADGKREISSKEFALARQIEFIVQRIPAFRHG